MIEVHIEPSPLPYLRTGETKRIRIRLQGGKPGEPVALKMLGVTTMDSESAIVRSGNQALTYDPIVDVILQAIVDGIPTITVSSPESRFESVTVNGHPILQPRAGDIIVPSSQHKPQEEAIQEKPEMTDITDPKTSVPQQQKKSWLSMLVGALIFCSLAVAAGAIVWLVFSHNKMQNEAVAAQTTTQVETTAQQVENTDAVESEVTSEMVAQPESAEPATAATTTDPTGCTFINENRPKVDGKYILKCDDGTYAAVGTYNGENFDWSEFEGYTAP